MWEDFKKFAFKGNVLDMAVGVVVGGAFSKIVTSLVNDIVMPFFGFLTAGMDFKALKFVLSEAVKEGDQVIRPESAILYGSFLQNIVDFLIISVSIFFVLKLLTRVRKEAARLEEQKQEEEKVEAEAQKEVALSETELLAEIRDLLKAQQSLPESPSAEPEQE